MKKTDMELQAIRDKLRQLESEPIGTGDRFADPWSLPQRAQSSKTQVAKTQVAKAAVSDAAYLGRTHSQQAWYSSRPDDIKKKDSRSTTCETPQAAALATLRQRSITHASRSTTHQSTPTGITGCSASASPTADGTVANSRSADSYSQKTDEQKVREQKANELVMQEIERLEIHAQNINERSHQQAQALLAMKRSAQQATVALRRQGIQTHPQLETIATFLSETDSAMLPYLERDTQGRFSLSHTTVDFHYAEQEAIHTAQALRNLGKPHFYEPIEAGPCLEEYMPSEQVDKRSVASKSRRRRTQRSWMSRLSSLLNALKARQKTLSRKQILAGSVSTASLLVDSGPTSDGVSDSYNHKTPYATPSEQKPSRSRNKTHPLLGSFSLTDSIIWFSAAAIARILIEIVISSYSIMRTPLMFFLFTVISLSIYRVFVSKSSEPASIYRLGITLLGLFLGSAFYQ